MSAIIWACKSVGEAGVGLGHDIDSDQGPLALWARRPRLVSVISTPARLRTSITARRFSTRASIKSRRPSVIVAAMM